MIFKIRLTPLAKLDIADSRSWYNKAKSGLGKNFVGSINLTLDYIKQNPEIFAIRYQNIRTAPVSNFPFLIHYFIDTEKMIIVVLAVLHTSRNPLTWDERKSG
jgi:hypothetical protein